MPRKRIGEILGSDGHLSEDQLQDALSVQAKESETRLIGQILLSRGYITRAQLQVALVKQDSVSD